MKIALTGGHGFIGSRVSRLLAARGDALTLLVRSASDTSRVAGLAWTRCEGDLLDPESLRRAMAGAEACVHLACVSGWTQMRTPMLEETIERGTRNVLEAAAAAGVRRVVFVSSVAALGGSDGPQVLDEDSPTPEPTGGLRYAFAKQRAEREALALASTLGLELVIVNPAEVYGPDDDQLVTAGNLKDVLKSWPAIGCTGGTSVVHVDDVAAGVVAALDRGRPGERYILGGDNLTVEELIGLTTRAAKQSKPVLILPNRVLTRAVKALAGLGLPLPVEPDVLEYATRFWFVSSAKACRELGHRPRPAAQTIGSAVAWLQQRGHV